MDKKKAWYNNKVRNREIMYQVGTYTLRQLKIGLPYEAVLVEEREDGSFVAHIQFKMYDFEYNIKVYSNDEVVLRRRRLDEEDEHLCLAGFKSA